MVRNSKTSTEKPTATPTVSSSAPVTKSAANPVAESANKKQKKVTPPVSASSSTENVVVEPLATKSAASSAPESSDTDSIANKIIAFGGKLQQLAGFFNSVKADFKLLEKLVSRELKNAQKISSRKKKSNGNRAPSGFVKPTRISDELAQFLGKTIGTEMARTDVSKEINAYIRSHDLQDKANGRKINADVKLATLLKLNKEDELTYFNLQRYMKHHFIKAEVLAAATV
jgi:chromatin remodeling complex protein RSC6